MKNITVSVDEETHRLSRIRAAELGTSVSALVRSYLKGLACDEDLGAGDDRPASEKSIELRHRDLDDVLADFDARGVGLLSSDRLSRDELYDEAITGTNEVR